MIHLLGCLHRRKVAKLTYIFIVYHFEEKKQFSDVFWIYHAQLAAKKKNVQKKIKWFLSFGGEPKVCLSCLSCSCHPGQVAATPKVKRTAGATTILHLGTSYQWKTNWKQARLVSLESGICLILGLFCWMHIFLIISNRISRTFPYFSI